MALTTPLHDWHRTRGATMAEFGGWDMPLWYPQGAVAEHLAVIQKAGLFDTSHMGFLKVAGDGAKGWLQSCFTRDLEQLKRQESGPGHCGYGVFLNEDGWVVDDALVYPLSGEEYLVVVNAGMGPVIADHLRKHPPENPAALVDLSDEIGKIDLQGPESARILSAVLEDSVKILENMTYFSFKGGAGLLGGGPNVTLTDGTPLFLSRTGYTGEFGFELFVDRTDLGQVWASLVEVGAARGLVPCGLAARDSLRTGAVLPLSHQDIGCWPFVHHPWPFALPYDENGGFTKEFLGCGALSDDIQEFTYPFLGYDPRKVLASDQAVVLTEEDGEIGTVLTCVADMALGLSGSRIYSVGSPDRPEGFNARGLVCGFVKVNRRLVNGQPILLQDRRRKIPAQVVDDIRPDRTARHSMAGMLG